MGFRAIALLLAACPLLALAEGPVAAPADRVPLRLYQASPDTPGTPPLPRFDDAACALTREMPVLFPSAAECRLVAPTSSWVRYSALELDVALPARAPTNIQVLVFMQDWDYWWYQNLLPGYAQPGATNHFRVDLTPTAAGWEAQNHYGTWHFRALMEPKLFGFRIFSDLPFSGTATVLRAAAVLAPPDARPPFLRNVRANARQVACFRKFELTFDLPDRYPDPFDTNAVTVTAEFATPDHKTNAVAGFYSRLYYRETDATGERVVPQGPPRWQVRFCPLVPGVHRYTLRVRDAQGEARWGPATFEATAPQGHGFVRVAKTDPRYFEQSDGSYFFPLGHNIRSPFDSRMDSVFPWVLRWPEGSSVYTRYFKTMAQHNENVTEVWMAAWSLGLEWSPKWAGYHGAGQFNTMNAWELDQVLQEAEQNGIHLNLVIHNHGKFGSNEDAEWKENPFNVELGGYLQHPEDYFSDPRALESFRKLMRYTVARWGYSPHVFAWELWSELDLTGSNKDGVRNYLRPEVVEWHRMMGRYLKEIDPNDHMVSSHVCSDYTKQNDKIVALPELDLAAVDAYYWQPSSYFVVPLLKSTAQYNNAFGKPVFVTEFGGSAFAQGFRHLVNCLHAGLWSSVGISIGGAPMFWWWGIVDEENLYPQFQAVSRFMQGEDRRDPSLVMTDVELLLGGGTAPDLGAQCLRSPARAYGWIYRVGAYEDIDPAGPPGTSNVVLRVSGLTNGLFQAEFWDTLAGRPIRTQNAQVEDGVAEIEVPPFARDLAFKIKRRGK